MKQTIKEDVQQWIEEKVVDGYTAQEAIEELQQHGCQSGMVSHLIYYSDTLKYYQEHKGEIGEMVAQLIQDTGSPIHELLRDWDNGDPFANEQHNQNLLSWFAFEYAAGNN